MSQLWMDEEEQRLSNRTKRAALYFFLIAVAYVLVGSCLVMEAFGVV